MKKNILALILALALCLGLTACAGKTETTTLKVAASSTPHAEILAQVKDTLAKQGIDLVVTEYGDYIVPNTAVEDGLEDANYFQHQPYLDQFNEENGTHLVSVAAIHYEPFGIYPCKTKSLDAIPDGATVAVPNDATNEARALQLLEANGLITLKEGAGLNATPNDIVDNPHNLQFLELEAAMLPTVTTEVDLAAINGNYALQAGLNAGKDALATEDAAGSGAQTYGNILCVKEGRENDANLLKLYEVLTGEEIAKYIADTYEGAVVALHSSSK